MQIKDIMQTSIETITEDTPAETAWHRMNLYEFHHLIVVSGKRVVGILSERDLGGKNGFSLCAGKEVQDLMTRDIIMASPDMSIQEAADLLRGYNIGCLPVSKNGEIVGIVTISDLLRLLGSNLSPKIV